MIHLALEVAAFLFLAIVGIVALCALIVIGFLVFQLPRRLAELKQIRK